MIAVRIFGYGVLAERWSPEAGLLDVSKWLAGIRRIGGIGPGWAVHFGPFHLMACRLPRRDARA